MSLPVKPLATFAILLLVVAAASCSRSGPASTPELSDPSLTVTPVASPTPAPTPVNPRALLRESGAIMEALRSFHFRLDHRRGGTPLLPGLLIQEAEGDVISPDQISTDFSGSFGGFAVKSSLITIGDKSYMTNPLSGQWEDVPTDVSPLGFFNPRQGIASMMSQVESPTLLPGGRDTIRVQGRMPAEALAPLLGATVKGTTVAVELAIDANELYLLEAVFDGRVTPTEIDGVIRVIRLSRFNEPITIEPPP